MNAFADTERICRWAILKGDYAAAAQCIAPDARKRFDHARSKNIKVVRYKVVHMDVSEDQHAITQDIHWEYFLLNRNIIKTVREQQVWRYRSEQEGWVMEVTPSLFQ